MSYFLAIDVGTSRTAAALARVSPDDSVVVASFPLGRTSDSAPSAIFVTDSELLFADAAERRGISQPERVVREFKRRIGDDIPIVVGDRRFPSEELYALTVAWVVDVVTEREGRGPAGICATVPVTWGAHRRELVSAALGRHGFPDVRLVSEPEAAARHYESTNPLPAGRALAVYDLGGGTFDAVILRKDADGEVRIVGDPVGIADFGGVDFDDAVLRHAIAAAGLSAAALAGDPGARVGLAALRRECVDAKESLSFDSEAVVPVLLGDGQATVRLTRAEFEDMIEGGIDRTMEVLADAMERSGVEPEDIDAILLTGGSSRIPRIAQLLSERFERPVAIDADPKAIIALGAARALEESSAVAATPPAELLQEEEEPLGSLGLLFGATSPAWAAAAGDSVDRPEQRDLVASRRRRLRGMPAAFVGGGALVFVSGLLISGAALTGARSGGGDTDAEPMSLLEYAAPLAESREAAGVPDSADAQPPAAAEDTGEAPRAEAPRVKTPSPRTPSRAEDAAPRIAAPGAPFVQAAPAPSTALAPSTPTPASGTPQNPSTPATLPEPAPDATEPPPPPPPPPPDPEPEPTETTPPPPPTEPEPEPEPEPAPEPEPEPAPTPTDPAPDPAPQPDPSPGPEIP